MCTGFLLVCAALLVCVQLFRRAEHFTELTNDSHWQTVLLHSRRPPGHSHHVLLSFTCGHVSAVK